MPGYNEGRQMGDDASDTTLEITVLSCKDLRCFNFFQRPSFYAAAALGRAEKTRASRLQKQLTPPDAAGGSHPEWNHAIRFDLAAVPAPDRPAFFLEFDFLAEAALFRDRLAGHVFVPLVDLLGGAAGGSSARHVMYQVRSPEGKANGVLSFSYKLAGTPMPQSPPTPEPERVVECVRSGIYPAIEPLSPQSEPAPAYCLPPEVECVRSGIYPVIEPLLPQSKCWMYSSPAPVYHLPPGQAFGCPATAPAMPYGGGDEDWWVVNEKTGEHKLYGGDDASCGRRSLYPTVW